MNINITCDINNFKKLKNKIKNVTDKWSIPHVITTILFKIICYVFSNWN